ncbi:DUF3427 domain-containing protein [Rothia sp. ZJ932]|uniref:DUF3427 domain-containing protein n=1 Tax=Rothia sp. ZJ932 TaxID=2810516 RepID=UPI001967FF76|nr:DUF3427 domain-containing protein [Rothia sp. ZJ932]QRZ61645.1 DUF3427 domain-containing protein [Rothia sp. ZJ932]
MESTGDKGALIQLTELKPKTQTQPSARPATPLSEVALLTNNPKEPSLSDEIQRELESADRVDLLCSFVKLSGINILRKQLSFLKSRGIPFRVLTTVYMGATERPAVDKLVKEYGAQVKVSYEQRVTRLHAKAWIFHRNSGFTTGYVGSSNLSHAALTDGLEWNVRVSNSVTPGILRQFEVAFQNYWESDSFESYDGSDEDGAKLEKSLLNAAIGRGSQRRPNMAINFSHVDVQPYPHQSLMLDELHAERGKGHHKNLAVAATGTGKTIFSALDYRRLCEAAGGRRLRLLFIAHQSEILNQAQSAFATVMRDESFGESLFDGRKPIHNEHIFATIQTLAQGAMEEYSPDYFDLIIIDEFHHSAAPSYRKILDYFRPEELLGLTATPERTDGTNVAAEFFEGRIATQLRLWDALEEGLLVPFHYYGIDDGTDLSEIKFHSGKYNESDLTKYYMSHTRRTRIILQQLEDKIAYPQLMRAIGFCVNVDHAKYMAEQFNTAGLSATYLEGNSTLDERTEAIRRLKNPDDKLCIIFTVNLFNEGVDIPEVDTLLMLRPTQSITLFQQQLGRGLRRTADKAVLIVLDFVGNQASGFRFDMKMRSFTRDGHITKSFIESPELPVGCNLQLDRKAQDQILRSIKKQLNPKVPAMVDQLKVFVEEEKKKNLDVVVTELLEPYLEKHGLELANIYGRSVAYKQGQNKKGLTFTFLLDAAGQIPQIPLLYEEGSRVQQIANRIRALTHVNDAQRVDSYTRFLTTDISESQMTLAEKRMAWGLVFSFWPYGKFEAGKENPVMTLDEGLIELQKHPYFINELLQIWAYKLDIDRHLPQQSASLSPDIPLLTHASYSREEIYAALGAHEGDKFTSPGGSVSGVLEAKQTNTLALTVTLEKSEKYYSPETMYRDYAITEKKFAWDSQNRTTPESRLGKIYRHCSNKGEMPLLFVRYVREDGMGTSPFMFIGSVSYLAHTGSQPMHITWDLERDLPAEMFNLARASA